MTTVRLHVPEQDAGRVHEREGYLVNGAARPVFSQDPLDPGLRPESNACSEGPAKVGDGEVNVHLRNPARWAGGEISETKEN
jgi:hypothetical protein